MHFLHCLSENGEAFAKAFNSHNNWDLKQYSAIDSIMSTHGVGVPRNDSRTICLSLRFLLESDQALARVFGRIRRECKQDVRDLETKVVKCFQASSFPLLCHVRKNKQKKKSNFVSDCRQCMSSDCTNSSAIHRFMWYVQGPALVILAVVISIVHPHAPPFALSLKLSSSSSRIQR